MKNKIAFKLTMYFSIALLLFSFIIGSVFMTLFKRHTIELHKAELEERAITMANNLTEYMNSNSGMGMMGNRQGGYGSYIRFIDDIAMTDVWIVDENLELITNGHMGNQHYKYADLPQDADGVVQEVFLGDTTFSQGFSDLLNAPTLTIGTPIKISGEIVGALLLHSPVEGMSTAINKGLEILYISLLIALVVAIILSIILALAFTKPLKKINNTAMQLSQGEYSAKTHVVQKDEIGELASTIDILSERLYRASRESEKLDNLRKDFIANISHELRTPVTVIRGSLEAISEQVITNPEQVKAYHQQILSESIYLQRLVNDLLELSRLQNLDFKIEKQKLNLCDVINDTIRSAEYMAQSKNIEIRKDIDLQIFMVEGDYGRLRQMLLNIIDNAIKFSHSWDSIYVTFKDGVISIRDNGIGISKEDIPYIFDRFNRVKSQENNKGTGLGLAIAKQIADRHNIDISINSKENEGTIIRLTFMD
jgi:signal transduction histidine kinase